MVPELSREFGNNPVNFCRVKSIPAEFPLLPGKISSPLLAVLDVENLPWNSKDIAID